MKQEPGLTTTQTTAQDNDALLRVENLSVSFTAMHGGRVRAVRDFSISIRRGEIFALVGESGCGKSVTAQTINRIIPTPPGLVERGRVLFEGRDLLSLSERDMHRVRGSKISMIFQEPMTSLNPVFTVGTQLSAVFRAHEKISAASAREKSVALLESVQLPDAEKQMHRYPHQLSGGMQQRVMIAMALAAPDPCLLIADEPTTALDSTTQIQILALLKNLQKERDLAVLLITHDMGVVAQYADRVAVMYAGRKVEEGEVEALFARPAHPYTRGLLASLPNAFGGAQKKRLDSIEGSVPDLRTVGEGCPFYERCDSRVDACTISFPQKTEVAAHHALWCHSPFSGSLANPASVKKDKDAVKNTAQNKIQNKAKNKTARR